MKSNSYLFSGSTMRMANQHFPRGERQGAIRSWASRHPPRPRFVIKWLFVLLMSPGVSYSQLPAEPALNQALPEGMAFIAAGEFRMGRTNLTADDSKGMRPKILLDDRPVHRVLLDAYYMDARAVTHSDYEKFIKATHHRLPYHWMDGKYPESHETYPIFNVSWDDANAYCHWEGKRLPTEAEWERAARGGKEGKDYPWGDNIDDEKARYNVATGPGPVGKFSANRLGLYGMAGNISEWCSDWFERTYYENSPERNPKGPAEGLYRIIRGGAWSDGPKRLTVFFRNWVRPSQRTPNLGFRCVKDAGP